MGYISDNDEDEAGDTEGVGCMGDVVNALDSDSDSDASMWLTYQQLTGDYYDICGENNKKLNKNENKQQKQKKIVRKTNNMNQYTNENSIEPTFLGYTENNLVDDAIAPTTWKQW